MLDFFQWKVERRGQERGQNLMCLSSSPNSTEDFWPASLKYLHYVSYWMVMGT
jgi:hypothetical protein